QHRRSRPGGERLRAVDALQHPRESPRGGLVLQLGDPRATTALPHRHDAPVGRHDIAQQSPDPRFGGKARIPAAEDDVNRALGEVLNPAAAAPTLNQLLERPMRLPAVGGLARLRQSKVPTRRWRAAEDEGGSVLADHPATFEGTGAQGGLRGIGGVDGQVKEPAPLQTADFSIPVRAGARVGMLSHKIYPMSAAGRQRTRWVTTVRGEIPEVRLRRLKTPPPRSAGRCGSASGPP